MIKTFENFDEEDYGNKQIQKFYNAAKRSEAVGGVGAITNLSELVDKKFTFTSDLKEISIFWDNDSDCMVIEGDLESKEPHEIAFYEFKEMI